MAHVLHWPIIHEVGFDGENLAGSLMRWACDNIHTPVEAQTQSHTLRLRYHGSGTSSPPPDAVVLDACLLTTKQQWAVHALVQSIKRNMQNRSLVSFMAHLDDDGRDSISLPTGALGTKALAEAIIRAKPAAHFMILVW